LSKNNADAAPQLKTVYIFISIILFMPILIWPIPMLIYHNPVLNEFILPKWSMSMILLLVTSVVMDSLLYCIREPQKITNAIIWVAAISLLILQNQNQVWFLALLFLLHSFRAAYILLQHKETSYWWSTFSWGRDITTACIIFLWQATLF